MACAPSLAALCPDGKKLRELATRVRAALEPFKAFSLQGQLRTLCTRNSGVELWITGMKSKGEPTAAEWMLLEAEIRKARRTAW